MGYGYPWFDDAFLLRFCRARRFDFIKITEMWINYMNFRRDNDIDNIIPNFERTAQPMLNNSYKHYQRAVFGVDKLGRPESAFDLD